MAEQARVEKLITEEHEQDCGCGCGCCGVAGETHRQEITWVSPSEAVAAKEATSAQCSCGCGCRA